MSLPKKTEIDYFAKDLLKVCFTKFKNKNYKGPDGVPAFFYIKLFEDFNEFFTFIFNSIYKDWLIPESWKYSNIST